MRANKTNTTDKFTLVREIIEEAKIGATGKLVADIGFLNVIKYFLNKDIRESFAITKELKAEGNLDEEQRKILNTKIREMFSITKAIKDIQSNLYVQQENVIEEYHADTINTGIKQTLVENNVMYKENDV
tara:strand:+ start:1023 stop:1412 length:390 start_codon:yes stop_codon:yes gene_type:complete